MDVARALRRLGAIGWSEADRDELRLRKSVLGAAGAGPGPRRGAGPGALAFFVLNLGAPALTAFLLLRFFLRQRDAAAAALAEQRALGATPPQRAGGSDRRASQGRERRIADTCEATVLFADLVGFTAFAAHRPPEQVVDVGTSRPRRRRRRDGPGHRGDAPAGDERRRPAAVAAGGRGHRTGGGRRDRAVEVSYDLWGDTVNSASRMQATAVPGWVHVTERVVAVLGDRYRFEPRGGVDVKGKGAMRTWFLVGRRGDGG